MNRNDSERIKKDTCYYWYQGNSDFESMDDAEDDAVNGLLEKVKKVINRTKLTAVTMLVSENSSMSDARTVECDAGYMTIKATVTELNGGTKYYYKFTYDTGYGILESEVKSFLTECVLLSIHHCPKVETHRNASQK